METTEKSSGTEGVNQPYSLHAIQLAELRVTELNFSANLNVDRTQAPGEFSLGTGYGAYDAETKRIQVKVSARMGQDDSSAPFSLFVELVGLFTVDESRFPIKHIDQWAQRNAPLVLYPYVREHAYALTSRAGFPAVMFPLLEVPTFRLMPAPDGEFNVVTKRTNT